MTIFKGGARLNGHSKERMRRASSSKEAEGENIKEGCIRRVKMSSLLKIRSRKKILKTTD